MHGKEVVHRDAAGPHNPRTCPPVRVREGHRARVAAWIPDPDLDRQRVLACTHELSGPDHPVDLVVAVAPVAQLVGVGMRPQVRTDSRLDQAATA